MGISTGVTSLIPSSVAITTVLLSLLSSAQGFDDNQPADTFRGLVTADKSRLGSTPPTCHNKCNQCHPCIAVQVSSAPSSAAGWGKQIDFFDSSSAGNRYSNYKPLGWKCRCGSQLYDP